ncbi:MAG: hypothetical protein B7Y25_01960 [Alphaproteobacteria bacterium 16-39-46]|nr:MAG: hypothetical protein B7Y25_01960 [Alphaproteobacteria bacterium 16-39-46]OZA43743.1 MAG: hypothetical protein B7X84_02210 [Alphaproteobacteria bacterium 17-39-52]HQS83560.1 GNAT family N-acetyltransferase [Alphaproteobacteria bacterium]HQS93341.1 GNAT family N-acetyltransferase [Alphaproteobacteria bacterium]
MTFKDPILFDLPMPIETRRLSLRPLMPGDGKEIFKAIEESKELFKKWLPWARSVNVWEDSEKTAREFYAEFIERKKMPLVILKNQRVIGMCGFNKINWEIPSASIGYWLKVSAQGNGYAREAIAALTLYSFNLIKLKRLTIVCDDTNIKSIQVAESLGYTLETRAKGLLENPRGDDLICWRRYVRFDAKNLEAYKANWSLT